MYYLYGNGNGGNHGCEALSRILPAILGNDTKDYVVNASDKQAEAYGLYQYELERKMEEFSFAERSMYQVACKLGWHQKYNNIRYRNFIKTVRKGDICFSIGGDNYCYGDTTWLQSLNRALSSKAKTVLMGNSVEPELLEREDILNDFKRYSLIVARESITYEALCKNGLRGIATLYPDPAFILPMEECVLPDGFKTGNMVGINISPTIMEAGKTKKDIFDAYVELIYYILNETDMDVALIPHVVWERSDDRVPLNHLYSQFRKSNRVVLIDDQNCQKLKYIISKCRFFIAARTHASIAAYSTGVPTLVVGYSIKAKGIAKDIFGDWNHYVVPAQNLAKVNDLKDAFFWIQNNEEKIKKHLQEFMPKYCERVWKIREAVEQLKNR